jgi:hypothetical protein
MDSTQHNVVTRRTSSESWGVVLIEKGIPSLLALGSTPFCAAAPRVKNRLQHHRRGSEESAIESFYPEAVCNRAGEPHTFEVLQATGVKPFGYQGLIIIDD